MLGAMSSLLRELRLRLVRAAAAEDGMSTAEYSVVKFYTPLCADTCA